MWKQSDVIWERHYKALAKFKQQYGHTLVPSTSKEHKTLGRWVGTQRLAYKKGTLSKERVKKLKALGFVWNVREKNWKDYYEVLCDYKREHGHTQIAQRVTYKGKKLGVWVYQQRAAYEKGELSTQRIEKLEELGFAWEKSDWNSRYKALIAFKERYGHCVVPKLFEEKSLGKWVQYQRKCYKEGILSPEKIEKLEKVGFVWSVKKRDGWNKKYQMLLEYTEQYGHCLVPTKATNEYKALGSWVNQQRVAYKKGTLKAYRVQKLEEIGFVWTIE
ncbi:helicase associated domain-containing protein [Priestia filamentosa]|uniref:helicase associated domain-containing protein n=1 Tax=Priestia filamentosa TaxID=1402861 RepID=UPI00398291C1